VSDVPSGIERQGKGTHYWTCGMAQAVHGVPQYRFMSEFGFQACRFGDHPTYAAN